MPSINGASGPAMDYASEVYSASLAKAAQEQQAQQAMELLKSSAETVESTTPSASSGSHMTTDNLGQNINIRV